RRARAARAAAGATGKPHVRPAAASTLVHVLRQSLASRLREVDVADRVHPAPVARRRVEARQHLAASIEDADGRPELADVGDLPRAEGGGCRTMDGAPPGEELRPRV